MTAEDFKVCAQSDLWTVAYKKYYRLWVNLALTTHVTIAEAEDAVHAVLQSAMTRHGEPFASLEHIRNYVAKSVVNRASQSHRRDDRAVRWDDHAETCASVSPSDVEMEDREQIRLLRAALAGLSERDFEVLKLRYFSGLTFQQIGVFLGLSLSTVKSREEAALRRVRKALRKKGVEVLLMGKTRGGHETR
jgi:RNA polymerase sigma factor (sigma-70 family)